MAALSFGPCETLDDRIRDGFEEAGLTRDFVVNHLQKAIVSAEFKLIIEDSEYFLLNVVFDMPCHANDSEYVHTIKCKGRTKNGKVTDALQIRRTAEGLLYTVDDELVIPFSIRVFIERCNGTTNLLPMTRGEQVRLLAFCQPHNAQAQALSQSVGEGLKSLKAALPNCAAAGCTLLGTQRCSGCKEARYCSRECQLAHWKQGHKAECCKRL